MENFEKIRVTEIYESIQGESSFAGKRCVFVRLTGCNLRCSYCDTEYAFHGGKKYSVPEILEKVISYNSNMVEITGGEPLLQKSVLPLMAQLCDKGLSVLIETSGNRDISEIDSRVNIIMDLKTPSSGESHQNRYENIENISQKDEVKFVIGDRNDYDWSKDQISKFELDKQCGNIIFSPVFDKISYPDLVDWILENKLDVTFQLQMHKFIWDPNKNGV